MKKNKKGWLFLALFLALALPIGIALAVIGENLSDDLRKGTVSEITLICGDARQTVTEAEEITALIRAVTEGERIDKAAHSLSEYQKIEVIFHKINHDVRYNFYISDSENDCVYSAPDGRLYLFDRSSANYLRNHAILKDSGHSFSEYPSVMLKQKGKENRPSRIQGIWNCLEADGTLSENRVLMEKENEIRLFSDEEMGLVFEIDPDYCSVLLTGAQGEILYSGSYAEMPKMQREQQGKMTMSVTCDWYVNESEEYHGSLEYRFDLYYDKAPEITFVHRQITPGEVLSMEILYSESESVAVTPTFPTDYVNVKKEGNVWKVEIKVSASAKPGDFSVIVMGSDLAQTLHMTVLGR